MISSCGGGGVQLNHFLFVFLQFKPISKRVHSERKEFAPLWSKFFPFRMDPFFRGEANKFDTFISLEGVSFPLKFHYGWACHARRRPVYGNREDPKSACASRSGPSCSKLTTSLVNDSLKFTSSDTQICWIFFSAKVSEYCILNPLKQLTEWPLTSSLS